MKKVYVLIEEEINIDDQFNGDYARVVIATLDKKKAESEFKKICKEKLEDFELTEEELEELNQDEYFERDSNEYIQLNGTYLSMMNVTKTCSLWIEEKELV